MYGKRRQPSAGRDRRAGNGVSRQQVATNVRETASAVSRSRPTYGRRRQPSAGRDRRTGNGVSRQQVATDVREMASAVSRSRSTEGKNVCFPQHDAFAHKVTMSATIPLLVRRGARANQGFVRKRGRGG